MDLPRIGKPAPSFKEKAVLDNKVFDLSPAKMFRIWLATRK
jgi:hypothetical protein